MNTEGTSEQVVRISLRWVVIGFLLITLTGFLGGILAQQVLPIRQSTNTKEGQIVTTVEEVTISPSRAAADIAEKWQRSVFLIGSVSDQVPPAVLSTGLLVTNDGVVVTSGQLPAIPWQAYGVQGESLSLESLGYDPLYDLSYYRLAAGVFSPADFAQEDPHVGHQLQLLGLSSESLTAQSIMTVVQSYHLPGDRPAGISRTLRMATTLPQVARGMPLLTDEGRVAGIVIDPEQGVVMPITQLAASMRRFTANQLTENILQQQGFAISYSFIKNPDANVLQFVARVTAVTPSSPASEAGLRVGDVITTLNGQTFTWADNFVELFSATRPAALGITRQTEHVQITL